MYTPYYSKLQSFTVTGARKFVSMVIEEPSCYQSPRVKQGTEEVRNERISFKVNGDKVAFQSGQNLHESHFIPSNNAIAVPGHASSFCLLNSDLSKL